MSNAATARDGFQVAPSRRIPIARALVWEECRVGGALAALCTALGCLMLLTVWLAFGRAAQLMWIPGDALQSFYFLMMPMLLALLLVLNPANSGHLMGGFSQRVLWLPVPVHLAVAIVLGMRTLFMALAVAGIAGFTHLMLEGGPPFTLVAIFVLFYLAVQTLDWLRAAVSGLSSLLVAASAVLLLLAVSRVNAFAAVGAAAEAAGWGLLLPTVAAALAAGYGISVAAVHASRGGRRIGIPEIWEWPEYFDRGRAQALAAFRSPVAAQVWFEWRRYGWTLPAGALLLTAFITLAYRLGAGELPPERVLTAASFAVFPAVLLSALAHGIRARMLGIRPNPGKPGFEYLLPRSSAEAALAKCLVAAMALVPTAILAGALHLAFSSSSFFTDLAPYALERGITTPREVAWTAASRAVLLMLLAWPLMAIGARGMRWLLAALIAGEVLAVVPNAPISPLDPSTAHTMQAALSNLMPAVLLLAAIAAFALAWRRRLIGTRTVATFGAIGLLAAWLLDGALPDAVPPHTRVLQSLAWGALVPLPFALYTLDAARKRHGKAVTQAEGASTAARLPLRPWGWGLAAATALAVLWMGWPVEPAFKSYLKAQGEPGSRADLNDIYPAVPDEENVALRLTALGAQAVERDTAFFEARRDWEAPVPDEYAYMGVYGMGSIPFQTPLNPEKLEVTRAFSAEVSSQITRELREMARQGPHRSRYPIDLREGFHVELPHLAPLRYMARHLSVDTLLASLEGDTPRALDNLRAAMVIQDSLANEPILISALVRIAILGVALGQAEIMLNYAQLTDADLNALDHLLGHALPPLHEQRILDEPLRGERMLSLLTLSDWVDYGYPESEPVRFALSSPMALIPATLAMPSAAEHTVLLASHEQMREHAAEMAKMSAPQAHLLWDDGFWEGNLRYIAPVSSVVLPSLSRAYLAEWRIRMQIDIARAGIAAERFRRAHGHWPDSLEALVPGFIEAVPYDVLTRRGTIEPVRHAIHDGAFVVYSVGMSGVDHGGRERSHDKGDRREDDLIFVVRAR